MSRVILVLTKLFLSGYKGAMKFQEGTDHIVKLLTTVEAAERLGVTVQRVQQLIWEGKLPAELLGRDYVIKESDLKLVANRPGRGRPPLTEEEKEAREREKAKKASKKSKRGAK